MDFNQFVMKNNYEKVRGLGDRLELMKNKIDWKPFIPLVSSVFYDNKEQGGRPHTNDIVVVKIMLLQAWYGLSDPELEFQVHDRLSFRNFLDFPKSIPDFSTIWKIRERLKDAGIESKIWDELQKQLDDKGYTVKKGVIQDATFVEADLGKKRHYKEKKAKEKGEKIEYTEKQKRHIDKDGTFAVKNNQVHYGYKSHTKVDRESQFIRDYEVTTASVHDGDIDLANEEDIVYRDRAYTGKETRAKGNASMKRGNLTVKQKRRNFRISRKRAVGERPFGVVKRVFNGGRTMVKRIERVSIKEMFKFFAYNLYNLVTQERKQLAVAI
ncbi:MAG: IS5 family transposase [Candidatus Omnitrophica bacterium]|nr:IS5 family transposase [Candidatus Omnitrophota bacterium]